MTFVNVTTIIVIITMMFVKLFWCSQSTTVLFRSIRPHQVLSEPWRR